MSKTRREQSQGRKTRDFFKNQCGPTYMETAIMTILIGPNLIYIFWWVPGIELITSGSLPVRPTFNRVRGWDNYTIQPFIDTINGLNKYSFGLPEQVAEPLSQLRILLQPLSSQSLEHLSFTEDLICNKLEISTADVLLEKVESCLQRHNWQVDRVIGNFRAGDIEHTTTEEII